MRDMHELLELAREGAPPARYGVDDIVAAGRRRRRWALAQRVGGIGTAAVAVVTAGVLVVGNLALSGGTTAQPAVPKAPTATGQTPAPYVIVPPFSFTFDGYRMGEYRVLPPDEINPGYQTTAVVRDVKDAKGKTEVHYVATMTVFARGVFAPTKFTSGTKLTVQGREAYQTRLTVMRSNQLNRDGEFINGEAVPYDALAWQYAPESWAVIEEEAYRNAPQDFLPATQVALAERFTLRAAEPVTARVPFRAGYLPAGYELLAVSGQSMTGEHRGMVTFVYGQPDGWLDMLTGRANVQRRRDAPTVVVSILWVDDPPPDAVKRTSRCNKGQHWCMTKLPDGEFYVVAEDPSETLPDAELLKVLDKLDFATIKKPDTWHPVA
jgi:hypothetical protein